MQLGDFWVGHSKGQGVAIFDRRFIAADYIYLWMVNDNGPKRFDRRIAFQHFVSYQPTDATPAEIQERLQPHFDQFREWRDEANRAQAEVEAEIVRAQKQEVDSVNSTDYGWRTVDYQGYPVFEVLVNGEPWSSPFDAHFRFGLIKSRMILTVLDLIELFWLTSGKWPRHGRTILIASPGLGCVCTCVIHPSFEAHGRDVHEPYLLMQSGDKTLGVGLRKADALLHLEAAIMSFVSIHEGTRGE